MLHDMYDAIEYALSMFMIYDCNVCACKLICCIAEENKSLTAAEENKSLTAAGDSKSLIAEDEKSLATIGDNKSLMTFLGI